MLAQALEYLRCNTILSIAHGLPPQFITEPVIHGLGDGLKHQILDIRGYSLSRGCLEEDSPQIQTALQKEIKTGFFSFHRRILACLLNNTHKEF